MVIAAKKNQCIAFHLTLPLISGNSTNQNCFMVTPITLVLLPLHAGFNVDLNDKKIMEFQVHS